VFVVIAVLISSLYLALGTLQAANHLHSQMLSHVLANPLSFFDTTPTGRILNRFNKDIDTLDNTIPYNIRAWLACLLSVMTTFCNIPVTNLVRKYYSDFKEVKLVSVRFEVMSVQSEIWYLIHHKHILENTVFWDVMSQTW
jgi:ABC-type multidrug transport system fused ATPase/permease subunit